MLERRFWSNFAFIFLGLVLCLSVFEMIGGPGPPVHEILPVYTVNTANSSAYPYPIEVLPLTDYNHLINLSDFRFNLLNEVCRDFTPTLVVVVHTSPQNYEKRMAIRKTWGQPREHLRVIFMLGTVENETLQEHIEEENKEYRDFAQGNFLDSYRNITYKHITAFKYVIYHCPQAKYILKTDDDVFVNMPSMMEFLNVELSPNGVSKLLFCTSRVNKFPFRSYRSKWRVSFNEYPYRKYPPYCPGWVVLYSPDVLFLLYKEAQKSEYFWIDDVLITGILAQKANIIHTDMKPFMLQKSDYKDIISQRSPERVQFFLFGWPNISPKHITNLWKFVRKHAKLKSVTKDHR